MTIEEYWEKYLNEDIFEIFDDTCEFFSKELTEDILEDYDVGEVILETTGHHLSAKKFEQVFRFIHLLREKQRDLYLEFFQFMDDFLVDYYCFHGNDQEVYRAFENFLEYPVHDFDKFLQAFKTIRFYQYSDLLNKAITLSYGKVRDADDLMGNAGLGLAICKLYISLQKELDEKKIDQTKILSGLSEYDFDFDDSFFSSMEAGLLKSTLDISELERLFEKKYEDAILVIEGNYLQKMSQKGFEFYLSGYFYDEMLKYWFREDAPDQTFTSCFDIDSSSFEKFLVSYQDWIFNDNQYEMVAVLWGSVYVYEFLYQSGIISEEAFNGFCEVSKQLKGKMIGLFLPDLWSCDFVHTWQKPDCVADEEFEAERRIFRKSIDFSPESFAELEIEISDELSAIGDLSTHILNGAQERWNGGKLLDRLGDVAGFTPGFLSDTEPIRVEKKPGRNDPCSCGSGKKYKKCCGK